MPRAEYDGPLRARLVELLEPKMPGMIMCFNIKDDQVWVQLTKRSW